MDTIFGIIIIGIGVYGASRMIENNTGIFGGGRSHGMRDSDFDKQQLRKGTLVEMEHLPRRKHTARDIAIAKKIAKDHLAESPRYYIELEKMEKRLK